MQLLSYHRFQAFCAKFVVLYDLIVLRLTVTDNDWIESI